MRPHYVGRCVFTSLADLLQKEELSAAFVRRRVFAPLGDLRKLKPAAGKDGEKRNERRRTKLTIWTKKQ
jgi:hypothetical protein